MQAAEKFKQNLVMYFLKYCQHHLRKFMTNLQSRSAHFFTSLITYYIIPPSLRIVVSWFSKIEYTTFLDFCLQI